MVSVFRGVGGHLCEYFRVVCGVFGCLKSQWSMDVFAGIYVCISLGIICCSSVSLQNWRSGAWYDLWSFSVGVAWRSPPISVVTVRNLDIISVFIHVRIFV